MKDPVAVTPQSRRASWARELEPHDEPPHVVDAVKEQGHVLSPAAGNAMRFVAQDVERLLRTLDQLAALRDLSVPERALITQALEVHEAQLALMFTVASAKVESP